jgi:acyl carrier protein
VSSVAARPVEPDLRDELVALSSDLQRSALLETHVREQLAIVLKTSTQRIDPRKPMGAMGVDSLMALEFVRRLTRSTGVKLPATAVFNYPTVATLAKNIRSRMDLPSAPAGDPGQAPATVAASTRPVGIVGSDLDTMSDDDALRVLVGDPRVTR